MKITLSNDFHSTIATIIPKKITEGRHKGLYRISASTAKRAKNKLCGGDNCTCGGNFGERGGDYLELINIDRDKSFIVRV